MFPLGVLCQESRGQYLFYLPFDTDLNDLEGNTFVANGTTSIVDNAMYTGSTGVNGVYNDSAGLLAFGAGDFEVGLECKLASFDNVLIDSFVSAVNGGYTNRGWQIYIYNDGRLSFYRLNSPFLEVITDIPVLSVNTWYNIKVKRISGQLSIIVDDVVVKTATVNDDFQQQFCVIGYQLIDNGNGKFPTRGYIKNCYGKLL